MHKKEKKQYGFWNSRNKGGNSNQYQRFKSITTIHPAMNEEEAEAVRKVIEKLPDC